MRACGFLFTPPCEVVVCGWVLQFYSLSVAVRRVVALRIAAAACAFALSRLRLRIGIASSSCFRRSSDARTHATKRRHHLIKAVLPIDDVNSQLLDIRLVGVAVELLSRRFSHACSCVGVEALYCAEDLTIQLAAFELHGEVFEGEWWLGHGGVGALPSDPQGRRAPSSSLLQEAL